MPELPDVVVYLEALERHAGGHPLERVRLGSPFVLRSVDPPLSAAEGRPVRAFRRMGKRLVLDLGDALWLVIHLMIAGRLRWRPHGTAIPRKVGLAAFDFPHGTVLLTEASPKKRAWIRLVRGDDALAALDPGGVEVLEVDADAFAAALVRENRTLKRALTDPTLVSGIGNAYSDEILHRARLSPVRLTRQLAPDELVRLYAATREVLIEWTDRLRADAGEGFPEKVTAFHDQMAVHGRYRLPCPVCGSPVQRIVHAENEVNYCPTCQTGGRLLADRALSRLLKQDWPKTLEELEQRMEQQRR